LLNLPGAVVAVAVVVEVIAATVVGVAETKPCGSYQFGRY